jgi:hypothetical protein
MLLLLLLLLSLISSSLYCVIIIEMVVEVGWEDVDLFPWIRDGLL